MQKEDVSAYWWFVEILHWSLGALCSAAKLWQCSWRGLLSCVALTFWQHSVLQYLCSTVSFCLFSSIILFPTSSILLCSPAEKQPYAFPVKLETMAVSKALRAAEQPTLRVDTIPNISSFHLGGVGVSRDCPIAASSVLPPHATH